MKKPHGYPCSLGEFFYDKQPTEEESLTMFLLDNPWTTLKDKELSEKARKTKTSFPLPAPLLLIRFTSLKRHISTILSWEKSLKEINSGLSPYQYLVENLPSGLPDFDGCRAYNMIIDIIMKHLKQMESSSAKVSLNLSLFTNKN